MKKTLLVKESYFNDRADLRNVSTDKTACVVVDVDINDLQNLNPPLDLDFVSVVDDNNIVVLPKEVRKAKPKS